MEARARHAQIIFFALAMKDLPVRRVLGIILRATL